MNNNGQCDNLDAYLADELTVGAAERFAAHIGVCADCRESVREQQWIDELLRSPEVAKLAAPPAEFASAIKSTLAQSRQRAGLVACVFATAAAVLVAASWTVWAVRHANIAASGQKETVIHIAKSDERPQLPPESITQSIEQGTTAPPMATVIGGPNTLVVPVESPYPDVTIVRIYPTYQPKYAAETSAPPGSAEPDVIWPGHFNGG